jgi:hypothetical protein
MNINIIFHSHANIQAIIDNRNIHNITICPIYLIPIITNEYKINLDIPKRILEKNTHVDSELIEMIKNISHKKEKKVNFGNTVKYIKCPVRNKLDDNKDKSAGVTHIQSTIPVKHTKKVYVSSKLTNKQTTSYNNSVIYGTIHAQEKYDKNNKMRHNDNVTNITTKIQSNITRGNAKMTKYNSKLIFSLKK